MPITATSWIGLAMVSAIRCMGIWTNNKCYLLKFTKSFISGIWLVPSISVTYFLYSSWGSEAHIRTGYICWYFCGVEEMMHVRFFCGCFFTRDNVQVGLKASVLLSVSDLIFLLRRAAAKIRNSSFGKTIISTFVADTADRQIFFSSNTTSKY